MTFVSKYGFENNISNTNIVKEWYTKIVNDIANHPIILEAIEDQIEVSDEMYIELKIKIKEIFITFSNEVKDLIFVLDFFNLIHTLKHPMMAKLAIIKTLKDNNNVDIVNDEIVPDKDFSNEMIRSYNIILANKLDNDNLVEYNK